SSQIGVHGPPYISTDQHSQIYQISGCYSAVYHLLNMLLKVVMPSVTATIRLVLQGNTGTLTYSIQ
ncbi:12528_t:CDS:1, partial [Ambispora leptoticha]